MNTLFDKIWDKHVVQIVEDGPTQLYIATVLNEVTGSTGCSELAHEIEGNILGCNTLAELAVDADAHRLR